MCNYVAEVKQEPVITSCFNVFSCLVSHVLKPCVCVVLGLSHRPATFNVFSCLVSQVLKPCVCVVLGLSHRPATFNVFSCLVSHVLKPCVCVVLGLSHRPATFNVFSCLVSQVLKPCVCVVLGLSHRPATFFVGGGLSRNRPWATWTLCTIIVRPAFMFVAACLDQCQVRPRAFYAIKFEDQNEQFRV